MENSGKYNKIKTYYTGLLPTLTEDSWNICESLLSTRTIKKGEYLLREGQICNHVSFVNHGLLKIYYVIDGREKIIEFFKEISYCCDYASFLMREPAETAVKALEDTEVVEINYEGLQHLYNLVPEANMIGRRIAENLFIDKCRNSSNNVTESVESKYQKVVTETPWLIQRVPQYMIASYLGITPEALSRIKARSSKKTVVAAAQY